MRNIILGLFMALATQVQVPLAPYCFCQGYPPTWTPECLPECTDGIGNKLDLDCVDAAAEAWENCEKEACNKYRKAYKVAEQEHNEQVDAAIQFAIHCMADAPDGPTLDACAQVAEGLINAADAAFDAKALTLALDYSADCFQCDADYLNSVAKCCKPCDPWDGWK